jgi:hypothetical protein
MKKIYMINDGHVGSKISPICKNMLNKIISSGSYILCGDLFHNNPDFIEDIRADKECKQLEILKDVLMKYFEIDEVDALTKGLDILDDLKKGGLIK